MAKLTQTQVLSGLMGVCVADALGVPVEFTSRADRIQSPVTTMQGYGTYNQPLGTWSDDSSLTLCLAEALTKELLTDKLYKTLADYFCRWRREAYWTPHNYVFDIGNATATAIVRLERGIPPLEAGGTTEGSNGNGSLMRILPLAFCHNLVEFSELMDRVHRVSCLTHAHPRSQIACGIYISIAVCLLQGSQPMTAYHQGINNIRNIYQKSPYVEQMHHFERVMSGNITSYPSQQISSSGYVVHTLEAALWCFLNSNNYAEAVLSSVNLGEDTDTTAAVTGGLAGIYYGIEQISREWIEKIARKDEIIDLAARLEAAITRANCQDNSFVVSENG